MRQRPRKCACISTSFPLGGSGRVVTRPLKPTCCPFTRRVDWSGSIAVSAGTNSVKSDVADPIRRDPPYRNTTSRFRQCLDDVVEFAVGAGRREPDAASAPSARFSSASIVAPSIGCPSAFVRSQLRLNCPAVPRNNAAIQPSRRRMSLPLVPRRRCAPPAYDHARYADGKTRVDAGGQSERCCGSVAPPTG